MNTVTKGCIGLGQAIAHFTSKGYVVNIPLNDNQSYDLIVDINNELKKIQVKTTTYKEKFYIVQLKSVRPNRTKNKIKKFDKNGSDFLFILTKENDKYLIPTNEIFTKSTMSLGPKTKKWLIK